MLNDPIPLPGTEFSRGDVEEFSVSGLDRCESPPCLTMNNIVPQQEPWPLK
jgi:hypothetical protein